MRVSTSGGDTLDELIRDAEIKALEQNKNKGFGQGNNGSDDQSSTEMSIGKTKEEREGR